MAKAMVGQTMNEGPLACTIADAAKALGVSRRTVYVLIEEGRLNMRKAGRRSLIPTADLRAIVAGEA